MIESVIKTKEEDILKLIKSRGFNSVRAFALSMGMNDANVWRNIRGVQPLEIVVAFRYARALHTPIDEILKLFRPEEMAGLSKSIAVYNRFNSNDDTSSEEPEEESVCQETV